MPTNTLTDAKCRAAKPAASAQKLFDGGGLFLFVTPQGSKLWRMAYRLAGKQKTASFGPYPLIGLAEARQKRDELKLKLLAGEDPSAKPRKVQAMTFREAAAQYWEGRRDLSAGYIANATRALAQHLGPAIGDQPIGEIDRNGLLDALLTMDAKGLHSYVRKTRMWAGQVFDWAVERGLAQTNPAMLIRPEKAFGRQQVERFAALSAADLPAFLARLSVETELQSVLALRLLALTWVRTTELRNMMWSEVSGDTWIIPAGKMKRRRDHVVPLSRQALALLETLQARNGRSEYVFPADHRIDRPMSENAVLYLLYRMGYKGRMTGHGFRSIASTWANESGHPSDVIERQLAHVPEDKTRAAYNRALYLDQRRAMLQAWAEWLDQQSGRTP